MSKHTSLLRRAPYVALGIVALLASCDRDTPTDVAAPPPHASRVSTPNLAASAAPTKGTGCEIKTAGIDVVSGNAGTVEVLCSAGKRALGGGFQIGGGILIDGPDVAIYESSPRVTSGTDGWRLSAANRTVDTRHYDVWVICAPM